MRLSHDYIARPEEPILVTGATGFIGSRVVRTLMTFGFKHVRCLVRPTSNLTALNAVSREFGEDAVLEIVTGNLSSRVDCAAAATGASVVYHLAAGTEKSFPGCFLHSVVNTRNLLDAVTAQPTLKRFVNVSSLAVYSNDRCKRGGLLDESCDVDSRTVERYEPYVYGKVKQDEIVLEYARATRLPYVLVRPGVVFGPGKPQLTGRVGIDTFGIFLHLGLNKTIPFTYVDNCAEAIVLAGLRKGIDGETFNVVDDDLPRSRDVLRLYKQRVHRFASLPVPYPAFYLLCWLWEKYSVWSGGQLPPVLNRRRCAAYWKGNTYSNKKAAHLLGWRPRIPMNAALDTYLAYARAAKNRAR